VVDTESVPVTREAIVLVAEDQLLVRAYIADVLVDGGFEALEASNADEAFELLQTRNDIDALLTDVEMPGTMNGLTLATLARRCWPHLAIVVMSGKSLPVGHALHTSALLARLHELLTVSRPLKQISH
jgi:CheY-like chemotaxis protein